MKANIFLTMLLALAASGSIAQGATIVQNGSFEEDPAPGLAGQTNGLLFGQLTGSGPGWDIYAALPGWTKTGTGPGIEVQTDKAVGSTDALFGEHYVELDSTSNSSMRQTLSLSVGGYKLSFWFSPRALRNEQSTAETNGIRYSIANLTGTIEGPGGAAGTSVGVWTEITGLFTVLQAGNYDLDFAAIGSSDSYGGFIDNVSVAPAPVPLPAAGLLLIGAIGGLAALRRRRTPDPTFEVADGASRRVPQSRTPALSAVVTRLPGTGHQLSHHRAPPMGCCTFKWRRT